MDRKRHTTLERALARKTALPPRVFISYSHDSVEHSDRVLRLADRLRRDGIDAVVDQYEPTPPEGWPIWMEREIRRADFVLLVCTETYLKRVEHREAPQKGLGVCWESNIIYNGLYLTNSESLKYIPVLLDGSSSEFIPRPLQGLTRYRVGSTDGYEGLHRHVTRNPLVVKPALGRLKLLPTPITKRGAFEKKEKSQFGIKVNRKITSQPKSKNTMSQKSGSPIADERLDKEAGHKFLTSALKTRIARWKRDGIPPSMAIVDVDTLTKINENYGRQVGDLVLAKVAEVIGHGSIKYSGRCGDDTFYVILLGDHDDNSASLRDIVNQIACFPWESIAQGLWVTCSAGIAHLAPQERTTDWPIRAAIGMRSAKKNGGNRVEAGPAFLPRESASEPISRNLRDYFS